MKIADASDYARDEEGQQAGRVHPDCEADQSDCLCGQAEDVDGEDDGEHEGGGPVAGLVQRVERCGYGAERHGGEDRKSVNQKPLMAAALVKIIQNKVRWGHRGEARAFKAGIHRTAHQVWRHASDPGECLTLGALPGPGILRLVEMETDQFATLSRSGMTSLGVCTMTAVSVSPNATDPTSLDYQKRFAEAVPAVV